MCGIGGILRTDGKRVPPGWVKAIDARLAYRGPDGAGTFRDVVLDRQRKCLAAVTLVHRRLAIIDIEGGGQPMVSKKGRDAGEGLVAVVFNGCIYNHRELRRKLEAKGRVFRTDHSDTEVLIHGHREWGAALTRHLEGMYAFALWDRAQRRLVLGRDWFGEKPLYVRRGLGSNPHVLAFASDARALATFAPPHLPGEDAPDLAVFCERYLQLGYDHAGETVYAAAGAGAGAGEGDGDGDGVIAEPPAIAERLDELMAAESDAPAGAALDLGEIETVIDRAVSRCLEADVPLGCFLSGGVDSSLVASFAAAARPDLATFSVRMPDARYDESRHAEAVAAELGTDHTTLDVSARPAEDLVALIRALGRPFGDSSIIPTYWISRAAREHVKAAVSGDGGDELFIGYERYLAARPLARHHWWLRRLPRSLLDAPVRSLRHNAGRLGAAARDLPRMGVLALETLFTLDQLTDLLGGPPSHVLEIEPGPDPLQTLRRADLLDYLPNDILAKVDTASMLAGIEVRAPLLARDVARAALAAAPETLMTGRRRKGLLRALARKRLPRSIADRPKMGFSIPIDRWFRNDFGSMRTLLLDHLHARDPFPTFPIRRSAVRRLVDEHLSGRRDHGQRLFALLTLAVWEGLRD